MRSVEAPSHCAGMHGRWPLLLSLLLFSVAATFWLVAPSAGTSAALQRQPASAAALTAQLLQELQLAEQLTDTRIALAEAEAVIAQLRAGAAAAAAAASPAAPCPPPSPPPQPRPTACDSRAYKAALALNAGFFRGQGARESVVERRHASWRSFAFDAFDALQGAGFPADAPDEPALAPPVPSLRPLVLLIGDSVDRNAVVSSCAAWAGATSSAPLAVGSSAEVAPRGDFVVCDADWGVLEAVHSYGLQQSGPYHLNNSARWNGPLVDTAARLPAIAAALRRRRGRAPDVVVYQAALWTAKALADAAAAAASPSAPPAPPSASIMAWHRERLRDAAHNVAVLREHFGPDTALLLRTAPVSVGAVDSGYFTNLVELNAATRLLGAATCTGVLDWAAALQGLPDARVFIDYIHPRERFSVAFGEALKVLAFALLGGAPIDLAKLLLT